VTRASDDALSRLVNHSADMLVLALERWKRPGPIVGLLGLVGDPRRSPIPDYLVDHETGEFYLTIEASP